MTEGEHAHPLVPDFADDLFAGTAEWYATYRPSYPQELLDELAALAPDGARRRLVDLACGPGTICLRIHQHFASVLAVDLEPDMIDTGRALAQRNGADNVEWKVARAEDVSLPPGSVHVVTVGSAFHRLNRPLVAARAIAWLQPGGIFAEVGSGTGITSGDETWQRIVADVYRDWMKKAPNRPVPREPRDATLATTEEVLRAAGFEDVNKRELVIAHAWSADEIIGYLFSTSYASRAVFGDLADEFAAALKSALLAHDPTDTFRETLSAYSLTGRRPAAH